MSLNQHQESASNSLEVQCDITLVPLSFVQGLLDVQAGRVGDLDDVLSEKPPKSS